MREKNQQETTAAERQVEMLATAFNQAKEKDGVWLNTDGRKAPEFYKKDVPVSPFNAIMMGLHSDQNNYKTNLYTLFTDAKKRGESVQTNEKGVPFLWYNWNEYANKNNPDDKISRADYLNLSTRQQQDYKAIRSREVRTLFNLDQTTFPFVDKDSYDTVVKDSGRMVDRRNIEETRASIRSKVEDLIKKVQENMVDIRLDTTGIAHYDSKQDAIYLPKSNNYEHFDDYARAAVEQMVNATGSMPRLAREGNVMKQGKAPSEDAMKLERLVVVMATAAKLQELGISSKLSPEDQKLTDYWARELKENPCLIDAVERDVNHAIDMIHKAERGEQVEKKIPQTQTSNTKTIIPKHFFVADEIKTLPNKDTKEMVIVRDKESKIADVVLPAGASLTVKNEIPGMNKSRIERALQNEGFEKVNFFNNDGSLGYRPDDRYFDGKDISVARLDKWNLEDITKLDVTDAVKRSSNMDFEKVLMLKDDEGKWAMYMKPEKENAFAVYPDKADINRFFVTLKQGNDEASDIMRQEMASKYYTMAKEKPEMQLNLFKSQATKEQLATIEKVTIFKTKETTEKPSVILCLPTISGEKQKPREVSPQQWQRIWLADDRNDYKTHLAASLFADVLRKDRVDAVGVGTDRNEQEAQAESKEQTQHAEFHEANEQHEEKEEQNHADYHEEKDKQETEEKKKQEEKKKEEQAKKEEEKTTKALIGIVKQFLDLKAKHPDALLLFRKGDFYETYKQDAEKASKILGITLTKSSKMKDDEGKPLAVAGFPYHALDTYLPQLIRAGQRVAICDQIEDPRQKVQQEAKTEGPQEEVSKGIHR